MGEIQSIKMSLAQRTADVAQKTVSTGLFAFFSYGLYNISNQLVEGTNTNKQVGVTSVEGQAGFFQMLKNKAKDGYNKYYDTNHREWYDKDDDSYLKQIPKQSEYT